MEPIPDTKMFFANDSNLQSSFENFPDDKQLFKSCSSDSKTCDRYTELSQFIDYSALLCDNKSYQSENAITTSDYFPIGSITYTDSFLGGTM